MGWDRARRGGGAQVRVWTRGQPRQQVTTGGDRGREGVTGDMESDRELEGVTQNDWGQTGGDIG